MADRSASAVDAAIRALYQGPLGEFTPGRQALAKRLQKEGDPRAAEVKGLAKPVPSAWAVNQLFAQEAHALGELVRAGERAHAAAPAALAKTDGSVVRQTLDTVRSEGDRLAERAAELAAAAGTAPSAAVLERLRANLDALALDPANAAIAARGWLDTDLDPPGFDVLAGLQLAAEKGRGRPEPAPARQTPRTAPPEAAPKAVASKPGRAEKAKHERAERERLQRIDSARSELERLERAAEAARAAHEEATAAADAATREAADAATRAEQSRRAANDARRAADAAAAGVVRAREVVRRAESS